MSSICLTVLNQSVIIQLNKRKISEDPNITKRIIALEVCDDLISQSKSRFSFNELYSVDFSKRILPKMLKLSPN